MVQKAIPWKDALSTSLITIKDIIEGVAFYGARGNQKKLDQAITWSDGLFDLVLAHPETPAEIKDAVLGFKRALMKIIPLIDQFATLHKQSRGYGEELRALQDTVEKKCLALREQILTVLGYTAREVP